MTARNPPAAPRLAAGGEILTLLSARCVWWEARETLLLSDLHLGKAAALRHHGLPVPEGEMEADLRRLSTALRQTGARELVVCGDLFHAPSSKSPAVLELLSAWRARHAAVRMTLVIGNHDSPRALPPEELNFEIAGDRIFLENPQSSPPSGGLLLIHDPQHAPGDVAAVCGHLHPAVIVGECGVPGLQAPCFWWDAARQCLVLPAFGGFTGGVAVSPQTGDRIFAVCQDKVLEVPPPLWPGNRRRG